MQELCLGQSISLSTLELARSVRLAKLARLVRFVRLVRLDYFLIYSCGFING